MSVRRYSIDGTDTATAATTILGIVAATTIRPAIYDYTIGCDTTPADQAATYHVQRITAAGTSTAVTPQKLDPADPASLATAGEAHSAEPTYTANAVLAQIPLNQRATYRWVASPGGELVMPATAANGLGFLVFASTTAFSQVRINAHFME